MTRNRTAHCGVYGCSNAIISGASKARRAFFCWEEAEEWGRAVNVSFSAHAFTTRLKSPESRAL